MTSSPGAGAPLVTGISPKEGPPGTKVTIRGERLGRSQDDVLGILICGVDCTLTSEWVSPNKILARTILCTTKGDIVVVTKSGGLGASTVKFQGYLEPSVGPTKGSAVWVEETISFGPRPLAISKYEPEDPLQISVEGNEKKFPFGELLDLFLGRSGDIRAKNFSPSMFLLENHHATSFEDLKSGLHFLSRKVHSHKEEKLSFLKVNISLVLAQLDALTVLKEKCDEYRKAYAEMEDDFFPVFQNSTNPEVELQDS